MAALVAAERHLWLTLSDMKKDMVFLMDPLLAPSGLFGDTFDSDVKRYQEARKQVVSFQRFLPRPFIVLGAAEQGAAPAVYQLLIHGDSETERSVAHYTVSVSPQHPLEIVLPTLPGFRAQRSPVSASLSSFHPESLRS